MVREDISYLTIANSCFLHNFVSLLCVWISDITNINNGNGISNCRKNRTVPVYSTYIYNTGKTGLLCLLSDVFSPHSEISNRHILSKQQKISDREDISIS